MVEINERGALGRRDQEKAATDRSHTGTFHHGEDGVSWDARDGLETGSSVLASDRNVHRKTTGALF